MDGLATGATSANVPEVVKGAKVRQPRDPVAKSVVGLSRGMIFLCVALTATLFLALANEAWTAQSKLEAETMTLSGSSVVVRSNSTASGGKEVAFHTNGSASSTFNGAASQVVLRARGAACSGNPQFRIYVDGALKGTAELTSSAFADYTVALSGLSSGAHTLRVSFENDYYVPSTCDRNAYLDYHVLNLPDAPPSSVVVGAAADSEIRENSPTANYGGATAMGVDGDDPAGTGKDEASLIKWDLSTIAPGARVGSASVTLSVTNSSPQTYEAYALKRSWSESQVTWRSYADGKLWESAGARGTLDRETAVAGEVTASATGERTFTLSPSVVQRWVDNPASNQGIIIADAANTDGVDFYSRESATSSQRPRLTVNLGDTPPVGGGNSPVLVGAGDIARCSSPGAEATARLLDGIPGTVFTTGDNAYEAGTATEFRNCYDPTWGRHKARTRPSVGNHEYGTPGASGYFGYFGAAAGDPSRGYYSYNLGEWHVISLNSMCENVGGCGSTSPMINWLKQDLAANPRACTVAYFHHPLFSSGAHGNDAKMRPAWDALYAANADVVLNGHDHHYERFAPQNPSGAADTARGIREFVAGMGGGSHYGIVNLQPNSQVRNTDTYGVLKLTLHPTSYEWKFVPEAGKTFTDSGTTNCH